MAYRTFDLDQRVRLAAFAFLTRQGPLAVTGQVAWADASATQTAHGIAFREPRGEDFALYLFSREDR